MQSKHPLIEKAKTMILIFPYVNFQESYSSLPLTVSASTLQRVRIGHSLPWFWDSVLSIGVVLHGLCNSKPEFSFCFIPIRSWEIRLSFAYLVAGYFSYISALALAPYRVFYAMAAIGAVSFAYRVMERKNRNNGEAYHRSRKHSHRH